MPHLDLLSNKLALAASGRIKNLMVMMPPRHGKSETVSFYTPAWFLETRPAGRVILCSYEADFAASWGRRVRNFVVEHADELDVRIADDSSAADRWHTIDGGSMVTAGVGGPITGKGGDLLILDDPIKNAEQAYSGTYRDKVWDWWTSTFLTRREPGASVVMVLTRWHEDDIAGRVLDRTPEDWDVIRFPAIAGAGDALGREPGEALWPARYNAAALKSIRREVGDYVWKALYQQEPPSVNGGAVYHAFSGAKDGTGNVSADIGLHNALPLQLSCDFNIDPGCFGIIGQYDPATSIATAVTRIHGDRLNAKAMTIAFIQWVSESGGWRWPELEVFGDASGESKFASNGASSWDEVREQLKKTGWPVRYRLDRRNPPVADRVNTVNNALLNVDGDRRYLIHPDCRELIDDMRQMKWNGNEVDKRDQKRSHASDADGYRIFKIMPIRRLFSSDPGLVTAI